MPVDQCHSTDWQIVALVHIRHDRHFYQTFIGQIIEDLSKGSLLNLAEWKKRFEFVGILHIEVDTLISGSRHAVELKPVENGIVPVVVNRFFILRISDSFSKAWNRCHNLRRAKYGTSYSTRGSVYAGI